MDDAVLQRVGAEIGAEPGLQVALVFGSFARGQAAPRSDIDVAVSGSVDVLALAGRLTIALGREVDVVRIENATIPLVESIVRDGIVVFERTRGAAAVLRARLLASVETDRPWYARMQKAWLSHVATRGILG